jgi:hypothetical protein
LVPEPVALLQLDISAVRHHPLDWRLRLGVEAKWFVALVESVQSAQLPASRNGVPGGVDPTDIWIWVDRIQRIWVDMGGYDPSVKIGRITSQ